MKPRDLINTIMYQTLKMSLLSQKKLICGTFWQIQYLRRG